MHQYRSSRGGVAEWRQSSDPYVAATVKPVRDYLIRSRGRNAQIGNNLSSAASSTVAGTMTAAVGSTTSSFSGAAIVAASAAPAVGASTTGFPGLSTAAASLQANGTAIVSLTGASIAAGSVLAAGTSSVAFVGGDGSNVTPAQGTSTVSFSGAAVAAAVLTTVSGSSNASFTGQAVGSGGGGGTADPADVWNFMLPNGKSAQQTLVEVHAMLAEMYRIHGLAAGEPLVVDKFTRTAGTIVQTITQVGDTVTVERTA